MKKKILITLGIVLVGVLGYFAWLKFSPNNFINAFYLVPKDAIYIIETKEPVKGWQTFSSSPMWQHLKTQPKFAAITANADMLDDVISKNQQVFSLFGSRHILISAHMTKPKDYDFLYLVDIEEASKSSVLETQLVNLVKQFDYTYTTRQYNEQQVHEFLDPKTRDVLYMCFLENNLVCSYSAQLVEKSIDAYKTPALQLGFNDRFREIDKLTTADGMCRLFLNFEVFARFMGVYMDDTSDISGLFKSLFFTGFDASMADDRLLMDGYTTVNDSSSSYMRALAKSGKAEYGAQKVLSANTSFMLNLGFKDFETFYDNLEEVMKQDEAGYKEMQGNFTKAEKMLGISIRDNFFSWMGDEVALAQYQTDVLIGNKVHNVIAIKAKNIETAKNNLDKVEKQIRKRTPLKFKDVDYNGFPVKYLEVKGLFKAMLGKLFAKMDKPYYTYLDDYVVFSDDPKTLLMTIDDFRSQNTLANKEEYRQFKEKFPGEASAMVYLSPLYHFANFKGYLSAESWKDAQKNQKYIKCFPHVGFGLSGDEDKFRTVFSLQFRPWSDSLLKALEPKPGDTLVNDDESDTLSAMQLFLIQHFQKDMHTTYYENGQAKTVTEMDGSTLDGSYLEYYENGAIKIKGRYNNGLKQGTWKYYNQDGTLDRKEKYRNGELQTGGGLLNRLFN